MSGEELLNTSISSVEDTSNEEITSEAQAEDAQEEEILSEEPTSNEEETPQLDEEGNPLDETLASDTDNIETVDIDIDGEIYVVPKKLEAAFLKSQDYTQKTTELAEQRKEYEAQQIDFSERVQMQEALLENITAVKAVDARLLEYSKVDWNAASARDPAATQRAWIEYQQLKDFKSQKISEINSSIEKRRSDMAASEAKLVQETVSSLKAPDPTVGWTGYTPESMQKLSKFAHGTLGISQEDMKRIKSPVAIKTLNLARIGHEYLQSMRAKTAKTTVVPEPAKKTPASRANAGFDPNKLPIDKWVIWERNRMAKQRQAMNGVGK